MFVSKGVTKPTAKMPTVKGYTADEAVAALKEAGFTNYSIEYDESELAGKDEVVRQNPLQGSEINTDYKIVLVCSKGDHTEKEIKFEVDLPATVTDSLKLTVLIDGAVDKSNTKTVIPAYSPYYTVSIKVKEDANVVVLLDDEKFREYKVTYDSESAQLTNSYPYVGPTEAPTEEPPIETEPEIIETIPDEEQVEYY